MEGALNVNASIVKLVFGLVPIRIVLPPGNMSVPTSGAIKDTPMAKTVESAAWGSRPDRQGR